MRKGETMTTAQKIKIGLANSVSLKGKKPWNFGLTKEKDKRVDYKRPTTFQKGLKPWNKNRKETRPDVLEKQSSAHIGINSGDKSHLWKGGITPINKKIRSSVEYKLWREAVFKRDNWNCVWCGFKGYVEADHIKPFAYYPELRFAIDNGRTLCRKCHMSTDTHGRPKKNG